MGNLCVSHHSVVLGGRKLLTKYRAIELNVGIICACTPIFPPLFKHHQGAILSIGSFGSRLLHLARTTIKTRSHQSASSASNGQDLENANANYVKLTERAGEKNDSGHSNGLTNIDLKTGTALGARIDRSLVRMNGETPSDEENYRF